MEQTSQSRNRVLIWTLSACRPKGEDLCGLGSTNQINEGGLENSSDIVITKSGRHSRKLHRSDNMHY